MAQNLKSLRNSSAAESVAAHRETSAMSGLASLKKRALSGMRWTISARVLVQLITWPSTIIVMRLLNPHDYGLVAMSTVVIGFVSLFGEPGLAAGLVQTRALREDTSRTASAVIVLLNLILFSGLELAAANFAAWFREPELTRVIRVASLSLFMTAIATVPQALLERNLRFRELALALVAGSVVGSLTTIVCALLGLGVWALVFGTLSLSAVRSILIISYNRALVWPDLSRGLQPVRHLVRFSSHIIGIRILWYWAINVDLIILGRLMHSAAIGSYSVGANLAAIPGDKAMEAVNRVSFPTLSRMHSEPAQFNATYERILRMLALYGFLIAWGLAAVAPEFVHVVLSDKWRLAVIPLAMLSIVAPIRMLTAFQATVNTAAGVPQAATTVQTVTSLLLPAGIVIGARVNGINGAAISWVLVCPLLFWLSTFLTCRVTHRTMRQNFRQILIPLIAGSCMLAVTCLVRVVLSAHLPAVALLCVELVAAAGTFLGTAKLLDPALLSDALKLLRDLLQPGKTATAELAP
jgi:O-antigen/teichoic acid export membrane protein